MLKQNAKISKLIEVLLSSCLNFQYNYFDDPTKLFLELYLSKFLDILAKSFFPYTDHILQTTTDVY